MYVGIRQAKIKPGMVDEVVRRINEMALPIIRTHAGFKGFYAVYSEDGVMTTFNMFEDKASAEASNRTMLAWANQNLIDLFAAPPTGTSGEVVVQDMA